MTRPLTIVAVGMVACLAAERARPSRQWWVVAGTVGMLVAPVPAIAMVLGWWGWRAVRRRVTVRAADRVAEADVGLMARSVLISVTAGMPLPAALDLAGSQVHSDLAAEIRALLRRARRTGLAQALSESEGRGARLYLLLARAQTTGASIAGAVAAFVDERRQQDRAVSLEAARKLPVKLTIPLALLILPGFVALTVGPSVLTTARRMFGPVVPLP